MEKIAFFKTPADSDVFILNRKLVKRKINKVHVEDCNLRSFQKESIEFKIEIKIQLGGYFVEVYFLCLLLKLIMIVSGIVIVVEES